MHRLRVLGLVAALVSTGAAASAQDVRSDQQILIELEQLWDAAFHRGDAKFIETLLADEFIATYGDGSRGDKAKELSLANDRRQQVDSSRLDEWAPRTPISEQAVLAVIDTAGERRRHDREITERRQGDRARPPKTPDQS